MNQNIRYKGLSLTPDELAAAPGTLALCANAEVHDGALRPSVLVGTPLTDEHALERPFTAEIGTDDERTEYEPTKLLYVHKTPHYTHFICSHLLQNGNEVLVWFKGDGSWGGEITRQLNNNPDSLDIVDDPNVVTIVPGDIRQLDSVGNTVVLMTTSGVHYMVWKGSYEEQQEEDEEVTPTRALARAANDPTDRPPIGDTILIPIVDPSYEPDSGSGDSGSGSGGGGGAEVVNFDDEGTDDFPGEEDCGYKYLGRKPPFVELEFSLNLTESQYDTSTFSSSEYSHGGGGAYTAWRKTTVKISKFNTIDNNKIHIETEEDKHNMTQDIWALINQTRAKVTDEDHFYANFLVRYCYRLYDGSILYHSAPVVMPVSMPTPERVYFVGYDNTNIRIPNDGSGHPFSIGDYVIIGMEANNCRLMYRLLSSGAYTQLQEDWSDVVKSIDIFVSPQYSSLDDSKKVETATMVGVSASPKGVDLVSNAITVVTRDSYTSMESKVVFDVPAFSEKQYYDMLRHCSSFYKICSLRLGKTLPTTSPEVLPIVKGTLQALTSQEVMTDDYKSHHYLLPATDAAGNDVSRLYVYNQRLNISGLKEGLYAGFDWPVQCCPATSDSAGTVSVSAIYVVLETEHGTKVVTRTGSGGNVSKWCLKYSLWFYPDSRAVRTYVVYTDNNTACVAAIEMEACLSLNGAIATGQYWQTGLNNAGMPAGLEVDDQVPMGNKIYTSDAYNPFRFPPESINTVGTGLILGIASTTRALSQGQFGQYPLMAFATDGIWALEPSSTGTYTSIHPISRDVCSNPDSICQLDQTVLFATIRGMSALMESTVAPISEELAGTFLPVSTITPGLAQYFAQGDSGPVGTLKAVVRQLTAAMTSPTAFFQGCRMIYDFANSRVIALRDEQSAGLQTAYVYSTRDKAWSTMALPAVRSAQNSYPHPYLQLADGRVFCLDLSYPFNDSSNLVPTLVITRALSYGDAMYVISDILHNRRMRDLVTVDNVTVDKHTVLFLFGSNDLVEWNYIGRTNQTHVWHLPARAWRYYRLALYNVMTPDEQYLSTAMNVKEKFGKV